MLSCSAVQREEEGDSKGRLMLAGKLGVHIYCSRQYYLFSLCALSYLILTNPNDG